MLLINKTKCPQILSVKGKAFPITIFPGMVFNPDVIAGFKLYDAFEPFSPESFNGIPRLGFFRSYALGDVIQLVPVARYFRDVFGVKIVEIATKMSNVEYLKFLYPDVRFYSEHYLNNVKDIPYFNLDGVLELDHNPDHPSSVKHRVKIYFENTGVKEYDQSKLDWSVNAKKKELNIDMSSKRKKIGIQVRGSTEVKTLKLEAVEKIVKELSKDYTVYLIHHTKYGNFSGENVIDTCGKLNVIEVVTLLTKLDCCITMDSGVLWMTHSANCPVLAILGATREQERLTLHPQYPKKAKAINIAEEIINCKPCFETKRYCAGKMNCMNNFDQDKLLSLIKLKLNEIVGD